METYITPGCTGNENMSTMKASSYGGCMMTIKNKHIIVHYVLFLGKQLYAFISMKVLFSAPYSRSPWSQPSTQRQRTL